MPQTLVLKDYNYEKPSLDVTGSADVDKENGVGEVFVYGDNFETPGKGTDSQISGQKRYFGQKSSFTGMEWSAA